MYFSQTISQCLKTKDKKLSGSEYKRRREARQQDAARSTPISHFLIPTRSTVEFDDGNVVAYADGFQFGEHSNQAAERPETEVTSQETQDHTRPNDIVDNFHMDIANDEPDEVEAVEHHEGQNDSESNEPDLAVFTKVGHWP